MIGTQQRGPPPRVKDGIAGSPSLYLPFSLKWPDRSDHLVGSLFNPRMNFHFPGSLQTGRGRDRHGAPSANFLHGRSAARTLPLWFATTLLLLAGGLRSDELAPLGSWSCPRNPHPLTP